MIKKITKELKKNRQTKQCLSCKRPFQNRKSWSSRGQWDEVKYCSDRCRKAK